MYIFARVRHTLDIVFSRRIVLDQHPPNTNTSRLCFHYPSVGSAEVVWVWPCLRDGTRTEQGHENSAPSAAAGRGRLLAGVQGIESIGLAGAILSCASLSNVVLSSTCRGWCFKIFLLRGLRKRELNFKLRASLSRGRHLFGTNCLALAINQSGHLLAFFSFADGVFGGGGKSGLLRCTSRCSFIFRRHPSCTSRPFKLHLFPSPCCSQLANRLFSCTPRSGPVSACSETGNPVDPLN